MKKFILLFIGIGLTINACKTVPLTGRSGFKLLSSQEVNKMSFSQYNEVLTTETLSTNKAQVASVKRVGLRIQKAVETYLTQNGHADLLEGYAWEFNLIESPDANAWCMPGGKVAFYTGILPICQDDNGIAVVMGHEIAHAIAQHGNERMSQQMMLQYGGVALDVLMSQQPDNTRVLASAAFGLGSQYGALLPFSRLHESEADELGLYFMAMAGYNPQHAVDFWKRMDANSGNTAPPEFMSTHPAHGTRIADIEKNMKKAQEYYAASNKQ